jgi:hypothetical protein
MQARVPTISTVAHGRAAQACGPIIAATAVACAVLAVAATAVACVAQARLLSRALHRPFTAATAVACTVPTVAAVAATAVAYVGWPWPSSGSGLASCRGNLLDATLAHFPPLPRSAAGVVGQRSRNRGVSDMTAGSALPSKGTALSSSSPAACSS